MISLVSTILNERQTIENWMKGVISQTIMPNEIVIVDGGSTDGTFEWLQAYSQGHPFIKVLQYNGNIASGRNFAIFHTSGDVVAVADAGCFYEKNWLENLVAPFKNDNVKWTTTGFAPWFLPKDNLIAYLIACATIPAKKEFNKNWLPSSRSVAFKKEIWQTVNGYPEWIPICEDVIFDLNIIKKFSYPEYIREALVLWRPRLSLKKYFIQLYRYTKSDGHGNLWLGRQLIRYITYLSSLILIVFSFLISKLLILPILLGAIIYCYKFYLRWFEFSYNLSVYKKVIGFMLIIPIVAFGDLAKMCGWPVGVYEKVFNKKYV